MIAMKNGAWNAPFLYAPKAAAKAEKIHPLDFETPCLLIAAIKNFVG